MTGSSRAARRASILKGSGGGITRFRIGAAQCATLIAPTGYVLFVKLLHVPWPPSLLGDAFPDLRELSGRLI
jgi:hypothetical protein